MISMTVAVGDFRGVFSVRSCCCISSCSDNAGLFPLLVFDLRTGLTTGFGFGDGFLVKFDERVTAVFSVV
tara:strand:- start:656 stop:865 length:210 start_codon:yes stop_codon:yes gene_type:complete